jgi:hypothetical protein
LFWVQLGLLRGPAAKRRGFGSLALVLETMPCFSYFFVFFLINKAGEPSLATGGKAPQGGESGKNGRLRRF